MPNSNFLADPSLPRPSVSEQQAAGVARDLFGISGVLSELGSNQDRNFLLDDGGIRHVLKFSNPAFSQEELDAQNAAAKRVSHTGLDVPHAFPALDGSLVPTVTVDEVDLHVRLLGFVGGETLTDKGTFSAADARALGTATADVAAALTGFTHPGTKRVTQWDLRVAGEVVELLLDFVPDADRRDVVARATKAALLALSPLRHRLRTQTIHGDLTDDNVVATHADGAMSVSGVIDFGDIAESWIVAELAVMCASILHHNPRDPLLVLEAASAFMDRFPLTDEELTALWPLTVLRCAVLVVSGEQQVTVDDENDYADVNRSHEWLAFETAAQLDPELMTALIRWRLSTGRPSAKIGEPGDLLLALPSISVLDFSVDNPELSDGIWLEDGIEERQAGRAALREGASATRYGEYRLTRTELRSSREVATLALGVEVIAPTGTPIIAPSNGTLRATGDSLVLAMDDSELWLTGIDRVAGERVNAGEQIGMVSSDADAPAGFGGVSVQLSHLAGPRPPFFVLPSQAAIWMRICPDPSAILGHDLRAPVPLPEVVLENREASFARVQEHYYDAPPQIERGWQEHLVDIHGQSYVDLVNNVASIGHAHPRIVRAVRDQWSLLNTNSRFHYEALARFSQRLADLAPDPLDTVFLVNSGSEAVDLALRLATTFTERNSILALREAYHGWTMGADAVSSSIGDNPRALETRPDWVQLVDAPHPYRGTHRGPDSGPLYVADLAARLNTLDREGTQIAAFIAEPVFGNAGGVLLPDGYLAGAFEQVRSRGGLCIADEVQVGYGRLGEHFWGSSQQGVVPDIITMAKAMGAGHPLGAVITRRDIAEKFAEDGSMFSSAGGSPVSCVVGLTVLDIIEEEELQENAREIGRHLKARLESLAERTDLIGAVHGLGLYLGVELVRDRDTLEPAAAEAAWVCNELLREACIVQPTGDHKNVLKIKPPMNLTMESADFFVDALDRVLSRWKRRG
jgi:4-aminobutyrate aminotransferase-like enzyme/Ser/Thr protein kinase RdoA (MazF antagonist)